jgi:hypothetical protein
MRRFRIVFGIAAAAVLFGGLIAAYATINSATNKTIALGNGTTTQFTFSFVGDQPGYISVIYTDTFGNQTTLTQGPGPTQYQLSLNAAVSPGLWGIGGTVTYNPSGTPIASGTTLTIIRTLPYVQNISLLNLASLSALATSAETGLDQLEMQIQQLAENLNRVVAGPVSDPAGLTYTLPPVAQRANLAVCSDAFGNITACSVPAAGIISSAMQPVIDAVSLAAGRVAFGLGSMALENVNGGTCGGTSIQDDGSAGGANGVGYARVVNTTVADSTNQAVTCAFHYQQHIGTGPITYTLPRANTLFNGFGFWVYANPAGGVITFAVNANDNFVQGSGALSSGVSTTLQSGAWYFVTTNAVSSGTWYLRMAPNPLYASFPGFDLPLNLGLSDSNNGSALTINITAADGTTPSPSDPVVFPFRSTTSANGNVNYGVVTAAQSITIPASATLGTTSNSGSCVNGSTCPFRIYIFEAYNFGSPELAVATCSAPGVIYGCSAWEVAPTTTTTISGSATAGGTLYTTTGVAGDAIRLIGFCTFSSGLGTAGTWASSCTGLHVFSPGMKKPGDVVRIVSGTSTSGVAITPSSAVNLVEVIAHVGTTSSAPTSGSVTLERNGGGSLQVQNYNGGAVNDMNWTFPYLDSPGVVTSTNYSFTGAFFTIGSNLIILKEIQGALDVPIPANDSDLILEKAA